MSFRGPAIFRSAVLVEAMANIASIVAFVFAPKACLAYIVTSPAYITPATTALLQWIGVIFTVATVPLLLCYPEPTSNQPPGLVTGRRRSAYLSLGSSEIALAGLTTAQLLLGGSGLKDSFLAIATATFVALVAMRAFFLYAKPEYMEPQAWSTKTR